MSGEDSNCSSPSNESLSYRSKRPKSKFEEFFEIIHASRTALCKLCQHKKVEIKMKNRNTSGLRKHLISFHKKESQIFLPVKPKLSGDIASLVTAGRSGQIKGHSDLLQNYENLKNTTLKKRKATEISSSGASGSESMCKKSKQSTLTDIKMTLVSETISQEKGKVLRFDHLTFWVANAKTASSYFVTRFGFNPLAMRESTPERQVVSYAVQLNKITVIFESPICNDDDISKDLTAHGDFVKDVSFEVSDLDAIFENAKSEGADVIKNITEESDDNGFIRYAVLRTYGDNTHTLIDRSKYNGVFLPGYKTLEDDPANKLMPATNLRFVDHVEGNMADGTLEDSIAWYEKNLNMRRFWCVDYTHELTPYSCISSASVINENENVLLSMNEAAPGKRPTSKASEFVSCHGTSGVEHVALYTDDIVHTMKSLKLRGADIVTWPPTYYDIIKEKLKGSFVNVSESIEELKGNNILIDFDEKGYMLQAFTKHLQVRPTLFIEIIQRRNHRGFGAMNYQWIFEAIERLDIKSED